jgi:glycerophosphoryl diester phosphodiesterase
VLIQLVEKLLDAYFSIIPRREVDSDDVNKARLIAHRGAHNNSQGILENTHKAFRLAQKSGCWGIELDVRATEDGVLVVNHDSTLTRLWGQDVSIADLTFNSLRALVPGIPSLAEVVAEYSSQMHLFIELKTPVDGEVLKHTLQGLSPCKDYHLLMLAPQIFSSLSQFPKQSLFLVAGYNNIKEFCELSIKEGYGGVLGNYFLFSNKRMQELKEAHQVLGVGFVDSKNSLLRELNRGVYWIFTNQAVRLAHHLQQLQNSEF